LILRKIILAFLGMIFSISVCYGTVNGNIYYIEFNWKIKQNTFAYYKMTRHIFESMSKEGIFLYSAYGNLGGVHVYISKHESYDKLVRTLSGANNKNIDPVIDNNSTIKTPLHKIFLDGEQKEYSCQVTMLKEFNSTDERMEYLTKVQYYILRRGHLIFMTSMEKIEEKFRIEFNFLADCKSKNEIVKKLLDIVSQDKKGPWILY